MEKVYHADGSDACDWRKWPAKSKKKFVIMMKRRCIVLTAAVF
jgi:hypothetical protein